MTYPIRIELSKTATVRFLDAVRILANVLGLLGMTLILGAAGASDAGTLALREVFACALLGGGLLVLWRVLLFWAKEKSRAVRRR